MEVLRYDSWHDPLTGLFDRRSFDRLLEMSVARSLRYHWPFTLVVIDLDGLKAINDRQGHAAGDAALQALGERFRRVLRFGDNAARIGGDEFAIILPNTDPDDVPMLLERIGSSQLGDRPCPAFSYGVAQCPAEADDMESLFKLADARLYEAKNAPRPRRTVNIDDLELELRKLPGVRAAGLHRARRRPADPAPGERRQPAGQPPAPGDAHRVPALGQAGRARGRALARRARRRVTRSRTGDAPGAAARSETHGRRRATAPGEGRGADEARENGDEPATPAVLPVATVGPSIRPAREVTAGGRRPRPRCDCSQC